MSCWRYNGWHVYAILLSTQQMWKHDEKIVGWAKRMAHRVNGRGVLQ